MKIRPGSVGARRSAGSGEITDFRSSFAEEEADDVLAVRLRIGREVDAGRTEFTRTTSVTAVRRSTLLARRDLP